ncbi:MAG: hypothetical protein FWG30_01285 [Eubacteriaceae bacterium]|nr:hypothetical protein [Eubacteriaceae bacterium]
MKKTLAIALALLLMLGITACTSSTDSKPPVSEEPTESQGPSEGEDTGPVAEEARGVTIPEFSIYVNGIQITQESVAAYPMYSVQAKSVNSSGTESTVAYVGFAIKDVLDAAGLKENYVWLEATAGDGYSITLEGNVILEDTTLLAMTKDGSPFAESPWLAPCSNKVTGNYLKGTESILVNTVEGAPEI